MPNLILRQRKQSHAFKDTRRVDPYRTTAKVRGTLRCPVCGSIYVRGRWGQVKAPLLPRILPRMISQALPRIITRPTPSIEPTAEMKCPACRQLEDRFAMGVVELRGDHWEEKADLIQNTLRNVEKLARLRNDQERILWTKRFDHVEKVYVTLPELARRMGRELERSFQGVAEYEHSTEEPYLRVRWWSDLPHFAHEPGAPYAIKRKSKSQPPSPRSQSVGHKSKHWRARGRG